MPVVMDADRMGRTLTRIAHEILERNAAPGGVEELALVGIRTRGVPLARRIAHIIREINREGVTIFLVEQNAHMALNVAHRAYVLQTGRIILSDEAKKLAEDPEVKKAYLGG